MNRSLEHAYRLLRKAREESDLLAHWVGDATVPAWLMGFHAQQAVEKALKAVLAVRGLEYPRTHSLAWLLDLVSEQSIEAPPDAEELLRLNPFGTTFRYEDESEEDDAGILLDRQWAAECAARVVRWAETALKHESGD